MRAIAGGVVARTAASMRPRRLRRGNHRKLHLLRLAGPRFNEAAAITPRKFGSAELGGSRGKGFNEAAAITPRKYRHIITGFFADAASMRPRRLRRGNMRSARQASPHPSGFNEAAAITPRKSEAI